MKNKERCNAVLSYLCFFCSTCNKFCKIETNLKIFLKLPRLCYCEMRIHFYTCEKYIIANM